MDLFMPDFIEEKIQITDSCSTTLNSSIQLDAGLIVDFALPVINFNEKSIADMLNSYIVSQEIWPKGILLEQKIDEIIELLCGEDDSNINKLTIIDAFLFNQNVGGVYENDIVRILKESGAKEIVVITNTTGKSYNEDLYKSVNEKLGGIIKVINSQDYHDRFWIADENKGFSLGTSLNGVGKRVTRIYTLDAEEINTLLESLPKT